MTLREKQPGMQTGINPRRLSLNTATIGNQWDLGKCIEACERYGFGGIAPWRNELQKYGVNRAATQIKNAGLEVTGLCRGGWFTAEGALSNKVMDSNYRAVDEALEIGANCLVMVVGGLSPGSKDIDRAREMVLEGLNKTLQYARQNNMPVAIEPLHPMYAADRACINTLAQALDICDALGEGIGVAVDVYHIWWDPTLAEQITRAGAHRLLAFHICDWLVPTRDILSDRGMMGDGVIDIPQIHGMMEKSGYHGMSEVEIFSAEHWWKKSGDEIMETIVERAAVHC
ncbi:sugar phosphate isomerase/epimerase [Parasalinivibrio latis]|uniref:sugar phosphate isomerase/epimerase family protein n=1 Tax=Parasalinivibrio latis TaxID=2952610 RepID=UPI0030E3B7E6